MLTLDTISGAHSSPWADRDSLLRYAISDRKGLPQLSANQYIAALFQTTAHLIQWRETDTDRVEQEENLRCCQEQQQGSGKLLILNSDLELALRIGVDGVHLKSNAAIAKVVEAKKQRDLIVGKSVHSVQEAIEAAGQGADYVLISPVFPPLSKKASSVPLGLEGLRAAVDAVQVPVFALGGVDSSRLPLIAKTGAAGFAGITWARREVEALAHQQG